MRIGQRLFTFIAEDKYIIECTLQKRALEVNVLVYFSIISHKRITGICFATEFVNLSEVVVYTQHLLAVASCLVHIFFFTT